MHPLIQKALDQIDATEALVTKHADAIAGIAAVINADEIQAHPTGVCVVAHLVTDDIDDVRAMAAAITAAGFAEGGRTESCFGDLNMHFSAAAGRFLPTLHVLLCVREITPGALSETVDGKRTLRGLAAVA